MKAELDVITEDEFDERYPLIENHFNREAAWFGCLFDTDGPEYAFVCEQDPRKVWTLVEDGKDGIAVISGLHHVNRLGYLVSEMLVPDGASIEASIETFVIKVDDADEE